MTSYLYWSSLKDFGRARKIMAWIGVGLVLALLSIALRGQTPDATAEESYIQFSSTILLRMVALVSLILSTSVLSQEIEQKTIVYLLTRPIARGQLLLMRCLASITLVTLLGYWMAFCLAIVTMGPSGLASSAFLRDLLAITLGAMAYGALFTLFSLLFNRAMLFGIIFAFGWELFVTNMPGDQYYLSIMTYVSSVANHPSTEIGSRVVRFLSGEISGSRVAPALAAFILLGLSVGLIVLSCRWFAQHEYVPREDAE
ncbi:MAG TPA: ABC transporter permease subunit [Fimbriimonadaceae bacterium]|nr:ABC transporter permease subunit [Fimbriimonadaceae bacterium]HRJ32652.1 ABC transporter permease subunit [Fimbriimonadaceae bacterium]